MTDHVPRLAFDLERDIQVLAAMASNLTPYLYENEIYGHIANDMPRLTLGGLLLRLYRLTRLDNVLDSEEQNQVQDARINYEAECAKWAVHFENKLQRELESRVNALLLYLDECGDDLRNCAAGYPSQAEKRIMIEHLRDEAEENAVLTDELVGRVAALDQKLRQWLREGEFIIADERLTAVYPRARFWWLYGYISDSPR
jgi:hypothetical protein